jgi:hypothetical protein
VAILIFGDSNPYLNENKQCADALNNLKTFYQKPVSLVKRSF